MKTTNLKNDPLVRDLRAKFSGPIIGIIGATSPDYDYSSVMGYMMGHRLQEFVHHNKSGKIFTGGVEGVGVDAYMGAVAYLRENPDAARDNFFLLIPHNHYIPMEDDFESEIKYPHQKKYTAEPYYAPRVYEDLNRFLKKKYATGGLIEVRAGDDMGERREYVAAVADVLVVLNGGSGTLDEARIALKLGTPIIVYENSGGAALFLAAEKEKKSSRLPFEFQKRFFLTEKINTDLIHVANSVEDTIETLKDIFHVNH